MIGVGLSAGLSGSRRARTVQDPLPALDLDWATNRSLPASYGPTPTFTRASTGTYFDGQGILKTAAVNGPRFNHVYNGTSWVSRGLLVEEQRTNLLQYSEQFNTSPWTALNASVSANSITSPDGNTTADKLVESATGPHGHEVYYLFTASTTTYTISVFAKAGERSSLYISLGSVINNGVYFNLSNGAVGTATGGLTGQIQDVGNGWFRCSVTGALSAGANYIQIALSNGTTYDYTGNGTSGLYLFGAQLESGAFPTSYIGTTNSSVVRSSDVCQITGTDFSGFWNGTEGSVVFEADTFSGSSDLCRYFEFTMLSSVGSPSIGSATVNSAGSAGGDNVYNFVWDSGFQAQLFASPARPSAKNAFAWKANDFAASINGAAALTDTSGTVPSGIDVLTIASRYGSLNLLNGHIARLRYYPVRLTNAKLQELST